MAGSTIPYPLNGAANWENFPDIVQKIQAGFMELSLTEWDTNTQPKIAAGSMVDINGTMCVFSSDETITGTTSNSTWYDIKLTVSGSSVTASFVARATGVWSDTKRGLYSGNDRIVGCVYKDINGNFVDKNILQVQNRLVTVKISIGAWNMDSTPQVNISHGLGLADSIRNVDVVIRADATTINYYRFFLYGDSNAISVGPSAVSLLQNTGGYFDSTNFDQTDINRGWIILTYEV